MKSVCTTLSRSGVVIEIVLREELDSTPRRSVPAVVAAEVDARDAAAAHLGGRAQPRHPGHRQEHQVRRKDEAVFVRRRRQGGFPPNQSRLTFQGKCFRNIFYGFGAL